jgi:hypothetical protein
LLFFANQLILEQKIIFQCVQKLLLKMLLQMIRIATDSVQVVVHHGGSGSEGHSEVPNAGAEKEEAIGCRSG